MAEVAAESGVPVETLRKIETGRIATPAFFTVVALAAALGVDLDRLAARSAESAAAVRDKEVDLDAGRPSVLSYTR